MQTAQISQIFQEFYQQQGFIPLSASSLLHPSVPMSFVMSAGLVQIETALNKLDNVTGQSCVLTQKCFRYFDIDRVGNNNTHLSLFEMPGAFYFTNNGKSITIERMWQFITEQLNVPAEKLWVTYFGGGKVAGQIFDVDKESHQTWSRLGIPETRLVGLGTEDNYWKQGGGIEGQTLYRKAGPNTEIFYDRGEEYKCSIHCQPGCRCGRFVEFANSLFVYNEIDWRSGCIRSLEQPFVETVIGSERVAMILQQKNSVFEIDTIASLIELLRQFYIPTETWIDYTTSEYVIVDHLRALVFLVKDGAPAPGRSGRQRLIKILIRKIITHEILLNITSSGCRDALIDTATSLYQLPRTQISALLRQYFHIEEPRFKRTIQIGLRELDQIFTRQECSLSGQQVVWLEKQMGLPVELVEREHITRNLLFQKDAYQTALAQWKNSLLSKNSE